jgi:hypothetical protein
MIKITILVNGYQEIIVFNKLKRILKKIKVVEPNLYFFSITKK